MKFKIGDKVTIPIVYKKVKGLTTEYAFSYYDPLYKACRITNFKDSDFNKIDVQGNRDRIISSLIG